MPRRLLGFNTTITIKRRGRAISDTGSAVDTDAETVATGVPATIQPHVLSNLPPPTARPKEGGLVRVDEYRVWLGDPTAAADVRLDDIIEEEGTSPLRTFRVLAVLDEAGRGHHQYLRAESYSQESDPWARVGEP